MFKVNIIYLTIVTVIAINSLAVAGNSEDFSPEKGDVRGFVGKPLASPDEKAQGKSTSPDLFKGIGNTEGLLKNGVSGSIQASKIERALKSPDKTFTEDGRTYKILNDHVPMGLLSEMANDGESIRGKIQQTLGPNGIGWQFHYNVPAVYNGYDELLWSLHPNFVGSTVDFRLEDITPHPPAWYEFWK